MYQVAFLSPSDTKCESLLTDWMFLQKFDRVDTESNYRFVNVGQGFVQLHRVRKMRLVGLQSWEDLSYLYQPVGYSLKRIGQAY